MSYPTDFFQMAQDLTADAAKLIPDATARKRDTAATGVRLAQVLSDLTEQEVYQITPSRETWSKSIGAALATLFVMAAWHGLDPEDLVRKAAQHVHRQARKIGGES